MENTTDTSAVEPVVTYFGETLIWPLRLLDNPPAHDAPVAFLDRWVQEVTKDGIWVETTNYLTRTCPGIDEPTRSNEREAWIDDANAVSYSEYHYFLPHVQRFLYPSIGCGSFRMLRRSEAKTLDRVEVVLGGGEPRRLDLRCRELLLYIFDNRVLILKLGIEAENIGIGLVQLFRESFRRALAPFLPKTGSNVNLHFPKAVTWHFRDGSSYEFDNLYADCLRSLHRDKVAHMPAHWRHLLQPLRYVAKREQPVGDGSVSPLAASGLGYQHLGYEQIPTLSLVSLPCPSGVGRGHQIRIAFSQSIASPDTDLPYSPAFLESFEKRNCYDRFYDSSRAYPWMQTRYFVCPYAFTVFCDDGDFAADERDGLRAHYRHHYSQLVLLAHLQKATLMLIRQRLYHVIPNSASMIAKSVNSSASEEILNDLLRFSNSCRFTEVSTQEQGQDLFQLLLEHLEIERLHSQLFQHAETIFHFTQAVQSTRLNSSTVRLTVIATFGLAVALALNFWGMNIIGMEGFPWISALTWKFVPPWLRSWALIVLTSAASLWVVVSLAKVGPHLARLLGIGSIPRDQD